MIKTSESIESLTHLKKGRVEVGDNSRAAYNKSKLDGSKIDNGKVDGGKIGDDEFKKKGQKTFKSKNLFKSKKTVGSDFFTPGARLTFTKLR